MKQIIFVFLSFFLFSTELLLGQTKIESTNAKQIALFARQAIANSGYTEETKIPKNTPLPFDDGQGFKRSISIGVWTKSGREGCAIRVARNFFVKEQNAHVDSILNAESTQQIRSVDSLQAAKAHLDSLKEQEAIFCYGCSHGLWLEDSFIAKNCALRGCTYVPHSFSGWKTVVWTIFALFVLLAILGAFNAAKERKESEKRVELREQEKAKDEDFLALNLPFLLGRLSLKEERIVRKASYVFTHDRERTLSPIKEGEVSLSLQKDTTWDGILIVCKDKEENEKKLFIYDRKYYGII